MELIEWILQDENINKAIKSVKKNKGAYEIDKMFLEEYGQWLRHKVRVVILKQWKKPRRIYLNLQKLNQIIGCGFTHEEIFKVANSRLGWYRRSGMYVVNFAISPEILGRKSNSRPGLVDPLQYYLSNI